MLATHHFNAYIDHYGHLYQKDKKHPGQYISDGIIFLMKYGKLLKLGQEKKENSLLRRCGGVWLLEKQINRELF